MAGHQQRSDHLGLSTQHVLEIGTGTGYNAALLARYLGEQWVTSIDIDPVLSEQARANLKAAGYAPTVVRADGAGGWPSTAPCDRIISTAAVIAGRLPYAWVEQTRPGGLILTPWGTAYHNGALVTTWPASQRPVCRSRLTAAPKTGPQGTTPSASMGHAGSGAKRSERTAGGSRRADPPVPDTA